MIFALDIRLVLPSHWISDGCKLSAGSRFRDRRIRIRANSGDWGAADCPCTVQVRVLITMGDGFRGM